MMAADSQSVKCSGCGNYIVPASQKEYEIHIYDRVTMDDMGCVDMKVHLKDMFLCTTCYKRFREMFEGA